MTARAGRPRSTPTNNPGPLEGAPATVRTVPVEQSDGTTLDYPTGVVDLDDAVPLADGITADRATAYAVWDTRALRFVSPPFTDIGDGRDYGATRSGRYRLRRV